MEHFQQNGGAPGKRAVHKSMEGYHQQAPGRGGKKPEGDGFWQRVKEKLLDWMDATNEFLHTGPGGIAVICAGVLLAVIIVVVIVLAVTGEKAPEQAASSQSAAPVAEDVDKNYDPNAYEINTSEYSSTILETSADAGQIYVDETLFLGDSNTARFELYKYCTMANSVGSVSMSAYQIDSFKCVKFKGYNNYLTMVDAMPIFQPKRVVITFGTNNLSGNSTDATKFITNYEKGIKALYEAYPYCDIIVNSIPPIGQNRSNVNLSQTQIDAWNQAIAEMCKENDWKYLNSAEVLKDTATGWAKEGYTLSADGVHLSTDALKVLFDYVRTHAYETEDRRPALNAVPEHIDTKNVAGDPIGVAAGAKATPTPSPTPEPTEEPEEEEEEEEVEATPEPTEEPTPTPTLEPTAEPTVEPTVAPAPEPTVAPEPEPEPTVAPVEEPPAEVPAEEAPVEEAAPEAEGANSPAAEAEVAVETTEEVPTE